MSRNGAGTYSIPNAPFIFDTVISETPVNGNFSDIANALTASIANDGQTPILANLIMSGYKHTGVAATSGASSRTEYASTGTMQDGVPLDAGDTGGTSTAYTAKLSPAITAYADKQCFRVKLNATAGATPTINFNSVGAKKMYFNVAGSATQVTTGDILQNQILILRYDTALDGAAGGFWVVNQPYPLNVTGLTETTTVDYYNDFVPVYDASASANRKVRPEYLLGLMAGHLYGLTLSNNGSDANNDIDIAVGRAVDNTTFALMELTSGLTKRLDAAWAVGTNQGGLDTGSEANSTWYYVWLIQRPDTGVVDVLFSTSSTSPTMPANYTNKRRIGAFYNDSSGNILAFTQVGDIFNYASARVMNSGTDGTFSNTAPTLVAISLAAFVPSTASELIGSAANNYGGAAIANLYVHNRSTSGGWQSTSNIPFVTLNGASTDTQSFSMPILSSNIYWTSQAAGGAVFAKGWVDRRGRDSGV